MKRLTLAALAVAAALALLVVGAPPAAAAGAASTTWVQSRGMFDFYGSGQFASVGMMLLSRTEQRVYLLTTRHVLENCGWGCGYGGQPFASRYENSANNWFDGNQVLLPGGGWATYDFALVDLGVVGQFPAQTDDVWNYCPIPYNGNCSSSYGGGTNTNANWVGHAMDTVGAVNPWVGMTTCGSGARSGTWCGTLTAAVQVPNGPGTEWVWRVDGIGNCWSAHGDSSGVMFYTADSGNTVYPAGILVGGVPGTLVTIQAGDPCFSPGPGQVKTQSVYFLPWSSAASAWAGKSLIPLNL